ncbi:MAG: carbohydrate kinase [Anaerolineae bacterium]|nr:carbohydrate kinase [Anaerolineae bacterium]HPD42437.1 carbohydrate kinase [Anaerolineae bacterium]HXK41356.1 carbohydrate kinase [Anaerolineae bacterium]
MNLSIPGGDLDLLVIGETLIDFISVEETESLLEATTFQRFAGGSPANIAANVAKLGGQAAVISKTGIDAFGQFLKAELSRAGVQTQYMVMDHRVRTSIIFVSRTRGTPDFEPFRDADFRLEPREISEEAIARAKVVHASMWPLSREPARSAVEKAFMLAQEQGKLISLDPNYSPRIWPDTREAREVIRHMMGYTTLTKPSLDDARRLFGEGQSPEHYIARFHEMGPRVVVFTMGGAGMILSVEGQQTFIPAQPVKVVDATGAGDSFWAGFLMALLDGHPLERCVLFAREIVGRKLARIGPLPDNLDRAEIYKAIEMGNG